MNVYGSPYTHERITTMPARHDDLGEIPESQKKAAAKYQNSYIQRHTLKLNVRTDMDIIRFLWGVPNKNGLIKSLLRQEIARRSGEKQDERAEQV